MPQSYNTIAGRDLGRIAALSDGVFAIAMTLIVLEIRVPTPGLIHSELDLWRALLTLSPRLLTYLLSFLTLGIFWIGQQTQLNHFTGADRNLAWIHLTLLATVAMMPFSTSLLAEFITFRLALVFYWANILVLGVILYASVGYARRAGLFASDQPLAYEAMVRRVVVYQALYAVGLLLCVFSTYWSIGFILLTQLASALGLRNRFLRDGGPHE
jgi:uncharacterized membrane protein